MKPSALMKVLLIAGAALPAVIGQEKALVLGPQSLVPNAHVQQVHANTGLIRVEVTLDRDIYLRGEVMHLTMTVSNPTSETLEVFDPAATVWDFLHWGSRSLSPFANWEQLQGEPPSDQDPNWSASTVWLLPGQRIERQVIGRGPAVGDGALQQSDRFMVYYGYLDWLSHAGQAAFRVVQPRVVAASPVRLQNLKQQSDGSTGDVKETPRYTYGAVLEANQKRYIVVSRNWTSAPDLRLVTGAKLDTGIAGYLEPYDRVAEVSREVQSVSLEANSDDNVVVHWVDESGARNSVFLDKSHAVIRKLQ